MRKFSKIVLGAAAVLGVLGETLNEIAYIDKYDYCVVNGELQDAVNRVTAIIMAEHSRVSEDVYKIIERYKEEL